MSTQNNSNKKEDFLKLGKDAVRKYNYKDGLPLLLEAEKLNALDSEAYIMLGEIFLYGREKSEKNPKKANEFLEKAYALSPNILNVHLHGGDSEDSDDYGGTYVIDSIKKNLKEFNDVELAMDWINRLSEKRDHWFLKANFALAEYYFFHSPNKKLDRKKCIPYYTVVANDDDGLEATDACEQLINIYSNEGTAVPANFALANRWVEIYKEKVEVCLANPKYQGWERTFHDHFEQYKKFPTILSLGGFTITFSENVRNYLIYDKSFSSFAETALKEFINRYEELRDVEELHDYCLTIGEEILSSLAEEVVKKEMSFLYPEVTAEDLLNSNDCGISAKKYWTRYFNFIDEKYLSFEDKKYNRGKANANHTEIDDENDDLKGVQNLLISSYAMDMAVRVSRDKFRYLEVMDFNKKYFPNADSLFTDDATFSYLLYGFAGAINIIKHELCSVFEVAIPVSDSDSQKARKLLEDIRNNRFDGEERKKKIIEAIALNPFEVVSYTMFFGYYGDVDEDLKFFAGHFGLGNLLNKMKLVFLSSFLPDIFDDPEAPLSNYENLQTSSENKINLVGLLNNENDVIMIRDIVDKNGNIDRKRLNYCIEFIKNLLEKYPIEDTDIVGVISIPKEYNYLRARDFIHNPYVKKVVIPSNIKKVSQAVFGECPNLHYITIEEGVESIDDGAFEGTEIEEVLLPNSVYSIGMGSFGECPNLSKVQLPENLKILGEYAFSGCPKLKSIKIPDSLESIGEDVFEDTPITVICSPDSLAYEYCKKMEYE